MKAYYIEIALKSQVKFTIKLWYNIKILKKLGNKMGENLIKCDDISLSKIANSIEVKNPSSNKTIAFVRKIKTKQINEILENMQKAQKEWANKLAIERADLLLAWYDLILANKEELAKIMTEESGKNIKESRGEIEYGASFVRWFAEEARRINGDILQNVKKNQQLLVTKVPVGVCVAITPWNFPNSMVTRKVAPALATGCAIMLKPSSKTPLSAYALANLAYKAGIPRDIFAVISGDNKEISDVFTTNKIVRKLSFTGSTAVGKDLYAKSSLNVKKISLELGGNAPVIVFDDANLQVALKGIINSKFRNSGQTCVCANRIYVQSEIYKKMIEKLQEAVLSLKVSDGFDEKSDVGPLIDTDAVAKVDAQVKDAIKKGARCVVGGKKHKLKGNFYEPTLLADVPHDAFCAKEETFGPLCPVFKFESEEEAIALANDTNMGLASYIFTENSARANRVAASLEYGMVGVNTGLISNEVAPFGGIKESGLGREGSKYGIDEYLELKYLCIDHNK